MQTAETRNPYSYPKNRPKLTTQCITSATEHGIGDFSSAGSVELACAANFQSLRSSPTDPFWGKMYQTHREIAPLCLEQKLSSGQGSWSQDRKDWRKKGVFVFRKWIFFTLKIKLFFSLFFFPDWEKRWLYSCFWTIPQNLPSYCAGRACQGSATIPTNSSITKVLCCRLAWILITGKVILLLLRFFLISQPLYFSC